MQSNGNDFTPEELAWFRHPITALALVAALAATACLSRATIPVDPRVAPDVGLVEVSCGWSASAGTGTDAYTWAATSATRTGTAHVVDARRAVTAAHVVDCAAIPVVHLTVRGERRRMVVRERVGADLAVLELASAGPEFPVWSHAARGALTVGFGLASTARGPVPVEIADRQVISPDLRPGDSGAPVYDYNGSVVGYVARGARGDRAEIEVLP